MTALARPPQPQPSVGSGAPGPSADGRISDLAARATTTGGEHEQLEIENPATGEPLGTVPKCGTEDIEYATARAREAQERWRRSDPGSRQRVLLRFHDLILDRQDEILDVIQLESGKARRHAFEEIMDAAMNARYYGRMAERHLRTHRRRGAFPLLTATWDHHHPIGVVGVIAPWNYPVVTGPGGELGPDLIDRVDYIMFTGSTDLGRKVASRAAERLIPSSMELGGKNAMIVLGDANLRRTVEGAERAMFSNAGQLCISMERLLVHESIAPELIERLSKRIRAMRLGASLSYGDDMGSLISEDQLKTVRQHIEDAVSKGATVLAGGNPRPDVGPYFQEATLLSDVSEDMTLFADETFGPVVSLSTFSTEEEAVRLANRGCYGLNFSLWTRDTGHGRELATRLHAGTVNINEGYIASWGSFDAPMGGMKDSGLGRRHGAPGILKYTEQQTVSVQRLMPLAPPPLVGQRLWAR
ncbi:MAG: succinate-semialdehyde dehydrogenase (NADP(+)), partial [Actinobacteria bacterium]